MPSIELIPVPLYESNQPYNFQIDNLPLQGLIDRILLLNSALDIDTIILADAQGSQGTLSNRLSQSINDDGSLKTSAINVAQHNIAEHTDGYVLVNSIPISYVRMLLDERSKLENIATGATSLQVLVTLNNSVPSGLPSQISIIGISEVQFDNELFHLKPSDSIYWTIEMDGGVKANTTFPSIVRHFHNYDIIPVPQNLLSPDYKSYKVTSTGTAYRSGSLRVFINGIRLIQSSNITVGKAPRGNYVPIFSSGTPTWLTYTYTEDTESDGIVTSGKFSLSSAISENDVITIDFDVLYTN